MNLLYIAQILHTESGVVEGILIEGFDELRRFIDYYDHQNCKLIIMQVDDFMNGQEFFNNNNDNIPDFPPDN